MSDLQVTSGVRLFGAVTGCDDLTRALVRLEDIADREGHEESTDEELARLRSAICVASAALSHGAPAS